MAIKVLHSPLEKTTGKTKAKQPSLPAYVRREDKIEEHFSDGLYGLLLSEQGFWRKIKEQSDQPANEYQVHWWAAVARIQLDGEQLDIGIPLVAYNYPQQVSPGSIDFNLKDVEKMSEATQELAQVKMQELQNQPIYERINELFPNAEWILAPMQQTHRHPGRMDCFSGTDLCTDETDPGICYPFSTGEGVPSFGGIICHTGEEGIELVHMEYRVFDGDGESLKYYKGACYTYVKPEPRGTRLLTKLFKGEIKPKPYILKDELGRSDGDEFVMQLADAWRDSDFEADTSMVLKENIESKHKGYYANRGKQAAWSYWDDLERYQAKKTEDDEEEVVIGNYDPKKIEALKEELKDKGFDFDKPEWSDMSDEDIVEWYQVVMGEELEKKTLIEEEPPGWAKRDWNED